MKTNKLRSRWYSEKYIEENSKTELGAAIMSRQKWYTLSHCKMASLLKNEEPKCGLCIYHHSEIEGLIGRKKCSRCILRENGHKKENCYLGDGLYQSANAALRHLRHSKRESDFIEFQMLAQKMFELTDKCVKILEKENV